MVTYDRQDDNAQENGRRCKLRISYLEYLLLIKQVALFITRNYIKYNDKVCRHDYYYIKFRL